jgi:hypothetical protein
MLPVVRVPIAKFVTSAANFQLPARKHRGRFIFAVCTLTRRIAFKTPFSDFKHLQMDYSSFFHHWAAFFRVLICLRLHRKFRLVWTFYPKRENFWDCDCKKKSKSGTTPYPRGASASAPGLYSWLFPWREIRQGSFFPVGVPRPTTFQAAGILTGPLKFGRGRQKGLFWVIIEY